MEASKITITPQKLNRKQKYNLRKDKVVAYIKSRPFGTPISYEEIRSLLMMKHNTSAINLMKRLIDEGVIIQDEISLRRYSYQVANEVRVTKPAAESITKVKPDIDWVEGQAKEFLWENGLVDRYSLIQFIEYLRSENE